MYFAGGEWVFCTELTERECTLLVGSGCSTHRTYGKRVYFTCVERVTLPSTG